MTRRKVSLAAALVVCLALLLGAGCLPKTVANYNPKLDATALKMRNNVDGFLAGLKQKSPPKCSFKANLAFYRDEVPLTMRSMRFLADLYGTDKYMDKELLLLERNLCLLAVSHQRVARDEAAVEKLTQGCQQNPKGVMAGLVREAAKKPDGCEGALAAREPCCMNNRLIERWRETMDERFHNLLGLQKDKK